MVAILSVFLQSPQKREPSKRPSWLQAPAEGAAGRLQVVALAAFGAPLGRPLPPKRRRVVLQDDAMRRVVIGTSPPSPCPEAPIIQMRGDLDRDQHAWR